MYEENERFSWTSLFIKIIIIIIFVLFTIWILQLTVKSATKGMSNSVNVLTDGIFSQNVEKMKEVGKSYFTTERLPEKIGEVKTLSLAKMYEEGLILEVKDKNGNACSAKNSYVSVEKMETEYQMKVYLECGEEKDSVKVIMGCYNYCDTDICERKDKAEKGIEYEYAKTVGGSWTPWGNWTNWSTTSVSKTNYRDVETKVVKEPYSYEKTIINPILIGNATCPNVEGYDLQSSVDGVCTYSKIVVEVSGPAECPKKSGDYDLVSQSGFTCSYSKTTTNTVTKDPEKCPAKNGDYDLVSQNGFTCTYSKSTYGTTSPNKCASTYNGYQLDSQSGFTCNYKKTVEGTTNCYNVAVGTETVWDCTSSSICKQVIQTKWEPRCDTTSSTTATTTTTVGCPSGYSKSGSTCVANTATVSTKTSMVGCPSGYSKSGTKCISSSSTTTSKTTTASCPSGYEKRGTSCVKECNYKIVEEALCDTGLRHDKGKCYRDEKHTETISGVKDVTYYRYRLRDYVGGTVDTKWSKSNNDTSLLNAGYKLTGKTRNIGGK